jgi:gamma-glutamylcyclotransferase (GGCT)/AIG2-like uncharacterized protein YtfP
MYYFAYGSNLDKKQMKERCPEYRPMTTAILPNYRLIFSGWSRAWHGGVATIRPFKGDKVKGAIYEITDKDPAKLDVYEGYPGNYTRMNVRVFDDDGKTWDVVTYVKTGKIEETRPSKEYADTIRRGYHDWEIT